MSPLAVVAERATGPTAYLAQSLGESDLRVWIRGDCGPQLVLSVREARALVEAVAGLVITAERLDRPARLRGRR